MTTRQIKAETKRVLHGYRTKAAVCVGTWLLVVVIVDIAVDLADSMLALTLLPDIDHPIRTLGFAVLETVALTLLADPIRCGAVRWLARLSRGNPQPLSELFCVYSVGYRRFVRMRLLRHAILLGFTVACYLPITLFDVLVSTVWLPNEEAVDVALSIARFLLVLGADAAIFLFSFRVLLTDFLFLREPKMRPRKLIASSFFYTKGYLYQWLKLTFSYTLPFLSCVLIVPLFWVAPSYLTAMTVFARSMIRQKNTLSP